MDKSTLLSSVMTKKVIVAELDTKFSNILTLFLDFKIYHLPVVFDNKLVGILSMTDALKFYQEEVANITDPSKIDALFDIKKMMTHNPVTLKPENTIKDAASLLASVKFRAVPITNEEGEILGIISNKDMVKILNRIL
jgi:CBS domain-containing protein